MFMGDSFNSTLFKETFKRVFEKVPARQQGGPEYLEMGFNAILEVKTCPELKIEGAIGCCANMGVKSRSVSEQQDIGMSGTCQWKFSSLTPNATIAVVYEVSAQHGSTVPQGGRGCVQFITQYQHPSGFKRIRVTTACRK